MSTLALRGHHLICLQFFRGEGYSAQFVENLERVVAATDADPACVIAGADDICAACPELGSDGRCASTEAGGELEIVRIDRLALELLDIAPGGRMSLAEARRRLQADAVGVGHWRASACDGCAWESVCEPGWEALLGEAEKAARSRES